MSPNTYHPFDEAYDVYNRVTFTTHPRRPQQQAAPNPASTLLDPLPPRPSSSHSSRSLRRISRQPDIRSVPRRRVVSAGASDHHAPQPVEPTPVAVARPQNHTGTAGIRPALSEANTESDESNRDNLYPSFGTSYWPRRSSTVSRRTASAILFALEEAIRKPLPFTTDWEEVNASMSDLVGGSTGFAGTVRAQNGTARASQGPVPVNTHPPSGVRTPTDIMRQRRDREARKRAEQEARDRELMEVENRGQEQDQQSYAAGVAGERPSQRRPTVSRPADVQPDIRTANPPPTYPQRTGGFAGAQRPEYQNQAQIPAVSQSQSRPAPPSSQQPPGLQQPQQVPGSTAGIQPGSGTFSKQQTQAPPTNQLGASQSQQQLRRAPFPHAFERWENLSSHWEGLTGYWIRKLEQNNDSLEKDPISQQMARQVTDLSAAGANLFHAVVELQRLRASSERKFQRWFFDTRSELERAKEVQAGLERQVNTERQARTECFASQQKAESEKTRAEDMLGEMRRELQISKKEARRAWEELGRREQEERDRTTSLRNGEPTLVGGVQVVPMIQGLPTRQSSSSRPQTRAGPYPGGPGPTSMGGEAQASNQGASGHYDEPLESPTVTDPFTEGRRQAASAAEPHGQAAGYYESEDPNIYPPTSELDDRSYGQSAASSDPGEEYGHYRQDPQGHPMDYPPSEESDDYDGPIDDGQYAAHSYTTTSAPSYGGHTSAPVDYSGAGWGWESVTPRHHHPTRLSDVIEEDEHSRTSPSRASRASQGSRFH